MTNQNDWWDYLAHSEVGGERKNHKYYARIVLGTDKHGNVQYRYFYDAREYGAYKTRRQKSGGTDSIGPFGGTKNVPKKTGRTTFVTGWSNNGKMPTKNQMERISGWKATRLKDGQSSLGNKVSGFNVSVDMGGKRADTKLAMRRVSAKTVRHKDTRTLRQRGKDVIARLLGKKK